MNQVDPPSPTSLVNLEIKGLPMRLWWKLMEDAQRRGVSLSYLIFQALVEKVGYDQEGEPYDLLVREIKETLNK